MDTKTRDLYRRTSRSCARVGVLSLALLALMLAVQPVRAAPVTIDNVNEAIANAKTAEDHQAIAAYFEGKAADARAQAEAHKTMLKSYERYGSGKEKMLHNMHCKDAIRSYENLAKDYDALAKEHSQMAKKGK